MMCPECEHNKVHTYDSRKLLEGVLRKRKCLGCDFRFYTYESIMSEDEFEEFQHRLREHYHDTGSQSETEREETA